MKNHTNLKRRALIAALMLAVGAVASVHADDSRALGTSGAHVTMANPTVEQRLQEDLRVVMLDLIQNGAFGNTAPEHIALDMNEPAQRVSNLGVLVDSANAQSARAGLRVVAITPGGAGEHMGLRAGDVLVAVNGISLADRGADTLGRAEAASLLRKTVDAQNQADTLDLRVLRDGHTQSIAGTLASVYLPAMHLTIGDGVDVASAAPGAAGMGRSQMAADSGSGCGRISVFDVAPRQQQLHAATLIAIDGQLAGPTTSKTFRISTGTHTLKVGERIESRYLSFNDRQRNANPNYKTLTVEVEPDTTYFLAARLNSDRRTDWKDGAYWDPVIWRQANASCR